MLYYQFDPLMKILKWIYAEDYTALNTFCSFYKNVIWSNRPANYLTNKNKKSDSWQKGEILKINVNSEDQK